MCFGPQRCAVHFFDISTSKRASETRRVWHFWLQNVLRATTACNFSSLIWPARPPHPPLWASLLFDPPEPQNIGKTVFRDFPSFSRTCIFSLLTFSISYLLPLWLSPRPSFFLALSFFLAVLFHLFILLEVSASKLPSIRWLGQL